MQNSSENIAARTVLIIWHSRTGASEALARAVYDGASGAADATNDKGVQLVRAKDVQPADILNAGLLVFVCPENLAAISGQMKEMFDRCYYPVLGQIEGRGFATIIAAGSAGHSAQEQIDRIAKGWRLRRIAEPVIVNCAAQTPEEIMAPKTIAPTVLKNCHEMGASIWHGLEMGMY